MGKTFLYRLCGLGKIPRHNLLELEREGIVLRDEGIGGSVTLRDVRAPGKRYSWKRSWFTGSLVITGRRFAAFAFSKPIINVPLDNDRVEGLRCSLEGETRLLVQCDGSAFPEGWSGSMECRFSTAQARLFFDRLKEDAA